MHLKRPFSPPKNMCTQELRGGIEISILQVSDSWPYLSDSGIGIDFRFPTLDA